MSRVIKSYVPLFQSGGHEFGSLSVLVARASSFYGRPYNIIDIIAFSCVAILIIIS